MAKSVRVKISKSPENILNLAKMVAEKNMLQGPASPLNSLNWNSQMPNIDRAIEFHKQAKEYQRMAEQAHEQRDNLIKPLDDLLKQSRDLLKAVYRHEPKKLGEFGYTVNDTV